MAVELLLLLLLLLLLVEVTVWVTVTGACTTFVCLDCFAFKLERMVGIRSLMLCVICLLIKNVKSSALGFTCSEDGWNLGVL